MKFGGTNHILEKGKNNMQIIINVPDIGFSVDIEDKFQDFFKRLKTETKEHLMNDTSLLCGNYELETIEMFLDAFKEMKVIPSNTTNGDMIKAMFPNELLTSITSTLWWGDNMSFNKDWWNAPCKKEV
jgi:hypothetical protein